MSDKDQSPSTGTADVKQATGGETPPSGATPEQSADQQEERGATPAPTESGSEGLTAALKAERAARKQAEQELAALKQAQDEGLTESQRLAKRIAELEAANKKAAREALVLKVATEYSIPPVLSARLHGETEDELRADAEALKQAIPATPQPTPGVGGPQGPPTATASPEEWVAKLRARRH